MRTRVDHLLRIYRIEWVYVNAYKSMILWGILSHAKCVICRGPLRHIPQQNTRKDRLRRLKALETFRPSRSANSHPAAAALSSQIRKNVPATELTYGDNIVF